MPTLDELINGKSFKKKDHRGTEVSCIRDPDLAEIAKKTDQSIRDVALACMSRGITPLRYLRNASSISIEEQAVLARSSVSVAGAGGLGGHIITLLARLGVGEIRVFDPDEFDETNLNRQAFSTMETLGQKKALIAASCCRSINPAVDVVAHCTAINTTDQKNLISGSQVIMDALDNTEGRNTLAEIASQLGIPMIHGAVAGFEGRVMAVLPGNTSFRLLYSPEHNPSPKPVSAEQILGTPALAPAFIAPLQVMAALHILLNRDATLTDQLIHADLQTPSLHTFNF